MSEVATSEAAAASVPSPSAIMVRITEGKNPRGIPTAKFIVSDINLYYVHKFNE
jgi:hypothetical protein